MNADNLPKSLHVGRGIDSRSFAHIEKQAFATPWPASAFSQQTTRFGWWLALGAQKIGFLYVQKILDEAEILRIAVHPHHRRLGLARQLWQAFMRDEGGGLATVHLEVAQSNLPARRFYECLGFRVNGSRKDYYGSGDDALLMVWKKPEQGD